MVFRKFLVVVLVFVVLALGQVGASSQMSVTPSSSGAINYSTSGSVLFADSFEDDPLGRFSVENPGFCPNGWIPDIDGSFGCYGEVVNTVAQDGNQSVKLYGPIYVPGQFPGTGMYSDIARRFGTGLDPGYPEFYVRWYHRFESLPTSNWQYVRIAFLSGGKTTYTTPTAWIEIVRRNDVLNLNLRKLWGNITGQTIPYHFIVNTWYKFELYYKYGITDGEYRLFINDEEIIAVTGQDTTPRDANGNKYTGTDIDYNLPRGWNGGMHNFDQKSDHAVYVDNFLFANYFYGQREPPIAAKGFLNVTASVDSSEVSAFLVISNSTFSSRVTTPAVLVLNAGIYNLTATYDDQTESQSVLIYANKTTSVTFHFAPAQTATLKGTVADKEGNGISGATIYCVGSVTHSTTTNKTGGYGLTLPIDNYTVIFSKKEFQTETKEVHLTRLDEEYTLDIILLPSTTHAPPTQLPEVDPLPFIILATVIGLVVYVYTEKKSQ